MFTNRCTLVWLLYALCNDKAEQACLVADNCRANNLFALVVELSLFTVNVERSDDGLYYVSCFHSPKFRFNLYNSLISLHKTRYIQKTSPFELKLWFLFLVHEISNCPIHARCAIDLISDYQLNKFPIKKSLQLSSIHKQIPKTLHNPSNNIKQDLALIN